MCDSASPHGGWSITHGSPTCAVVGHCIHDLGYGPRELCSFLYRGSVTISRSSWALQAHPQCALDYLQTGVGGAKYCGDDGAAADAALVFPAAGLTVSGVTTFTFQAGEGAGASAGFKLCAPTAAPTPSPTPAPTTQPTPAPTTADVCVPGMFRPKGLTGVEAFHCKHCQGGRF